MSIIGATAVELLKRLDRADVQSAEVVAAYRDEITNNDGKINAFLHVDRDRALAEARAIDERRRSGERIGKLGGLPVAIKDVICSSGEPATCGSRMLERFVPPYDAHVIGLLKEADAVLIGRTNMDEFAMGSSTENSAFKTTRNPWDLDRTPGGSSGGLAAAVAGGMAPPALGSGEGGAVRRPRE